MGGMPGMMGGRGGNSIQPDIVWHRYNPYPKLSRRGVSDQWIFAHKDYISDDDPVTEGLNEIFFPVPGAIEENKSSPNKLKFTPLVTTTEDGGRISYSKYVENFRTPGKLKSEQGAVKGKQVVVARITGRPLPGRRMTEQALDDEKGKKDAKDADEGEPRQRDIDVIYVADIDLMFSAFFNLRARPDELMDIKWKFENVTFLLNIIDSLAGDDAFVEIRKRQPRFGTLRRIERFVTEARAAQDNERTELELVLNTALEKAKEDKVGTELQKNLDKLRAENSRRDQIENATIKLAMHEKNQTRTLAVITKREQREFDQAVRRIRAGADRQIQNYQIRCILWAVLLPPIPPLLIALGVFIRRRVREREGVHRERLR